MGPGAVRACQPGRDGAERRPAERRHRGVATPPCRATRWQGNADLWPVLPVGAGTARRRRAAGRTPSSGVVRLSAGTAAFSVIRTGPWYTPFAALRAAVPAPTGRTGRRSAFPCRHAIWTVGVPARGCIFTATGRRSLAGGAIRTAGFSGGTAFSQQRQQRSGRFCGRNASLRRETPAREMRLVLDQEAALDRNRMGPGRALGDFVGP